MADWQGYIRGLIGLIAIVNPVGAIPVFVSSTHSHSRPEQIRTARIAAITVALTLIAAAWVGEILLTVFGIGIPAFRVGGGILLLTMAISMLHARVAAAKHGPDEALDAMERDAVGVVPLGIPLLSGPGSIALVIIESNRVPGFEHMMILSASILVVALIVWIALRLATAIQKRLGRTEINIFTRLMGLILAAIAVEFIARGLSDLFPSLRG